MTGDPAHLPRMRIRSYSVRPSTWGFTGKAMGLFLLVLMLAGLIGSFYLSQASHIAAAGLEIVRLTRERERLRQDNAELRKRIAETEALPAIRTRAAELGLTETTDVEYIFVDTSRSELPRRESVSPSPREQEDLSQPESLGWQVSRWWQELAAQFESWMSIEP